MFGLTHRRRERIRARPFPQEWAGIIGRNVVFHEFAHQLDEEDGSANGAPLLPRRSMYGAWARILGEDYAELVRDAEAGRSSCLDQYGATNPAEFFAVATESFFENPVMLRDRHPRLYAELMLY
jgi:Mlc titration factor MtfA (ptsG expression regulator)